MKEKHKSIGSSSLDSQSYGSESEEIDMTKYLKVEEFESFKTGVETML